MISGLEIDLLAGINRPDAVAKALSIHFLREPRFLLLFSSPQHCTSGKYLLRRSPITKWHCSPIWNVPIALMHTGLFRTPQDATQAFGQMLAFALGLYPLANPSDPAKSALKHPQLSFLELNMGIELEAGLGILLKGCIYVGLAS